MADAQRKYSSADETRVRILLGVFEAGLSGIPPTYADLRDLTSLSNGALSHHIPRLSAAGLLSTQHGARGLTLTPTGTAHLEELGLIAVLSQTPVYAMTSAAYELLEREPTSIHDAEVGV